MVKFFKSIGEKLSNSMTAPGAGEPDSYYEDDYDNGYYDDYDDQEGYYDEPEPINVRPSSNRTKTASKSSSYSSSRSSRTTPVRDNVYGFNPSTLNVHKQSETIIMHPKNMEDAVEIGSHVRSGRMCIVDLTGVPTSEAQRIADYLCGNSDALDGAITRVNNTIIAVSPPNHRVMPDYREEGPFDAGFLKASSDR